MKTKNKKRGGIFLSVCLALALTAASVPAAAALDATVPLSFSGEVDYYGNRSILNQYVCKNGSSVKLLNQSTLYRYDVAEGCFHAEYTFPEQQEIIPDAGTGTYRLFSGVRAAYINEHTGMLYYAYDKYYKINSTDNMAVGLVIYDLEQSRMVAAREYKGENLSAVGADDEGNVYLAVRQQFAEIGNKTALYVIDKNGTVRTKKELANPIDTFCGFADGGKFYCSETTYTLSGDNSYSVRRRLLSGSYRDGRLTVGGEPITSFHPRYNRPAEVTDGKLVTYMGQIYDTADGTEVEHFQTPSASDEKYYEHYCGANLFTDGNLAVALTGPRSVTCYRLDAGSATAQYTAARDIVSIRSFPGGVLALTREGTRYGYLVIPFADFTPVEEISVMLNRLPAYQRTRGDIVRRFAQSVPQDYTAPLFETTGSSNAPYRAFTLTAQSQKNAVSVANYYRWLAGLTLFQAGDETAWSNAANGAVLTEKNYVLTGRLSHYPDQPKDMDDAFYAAGYDAVSVSNIGYGMTQGQYSLLNLSRGFLNDEGYSVPGHRNTFLTRNGYRFAAGYSEYGAVNTIQYVGNPNPQGAAVLDNNQAAYAWPSPGDFPEQEISVTAMWSVNLNTDLAGLTRRQPVVTITDLQTGERFVRDSQETGLYTTDSWGRYLSFLPPEAESYSGKSYHVEIVHLADARCTPVKLEYTVNFFSYSDETEIDGVRYTADSYGRLVAAEPAYMPGDVNGDGRVTIGDVTEIQRYIAELCDFDRRAFLAGDVNRDGDVTVADATLLQRYLAEYIREL